MMKFGLVESSIHLLKRKSLFPPIQKICVFVCSTNPITFDSLPVQHFEWRVTFNCFCVYELLKVYLYAKRSDVWERFALEQRDTFAIFYVD